MNTKQEITIHKPKIYKLNKVLRRAVRQNTSMNIIDMDAWTRDKEEGIVSWGGRHICLVLEILCPLLMNWRNDVYGLLESPETHTA